MKEKLLELGFEMSDHHFVKHLGHTRLLMIATNGNVVLCDNYNAVRLFEFNYDKIVNFLNIQTSNEDDGLVPFLPE